MTVTLIITDMKGQFSAVIRPAVQKLNHERNLTYQ